MDRERDRNRSTSGTLVFNRRTLVALVAVTALLAGAYALSHPLVQYGAWLVAFTIWMVWFVFAAAEWISNADF